MSACSSPTPSHFSLAVKKEIRKIHELHYITIPLISALHEATHATTANQHSRNENFILRSPSPRLSPTPSLVDECESANDSSVCFSGSTSLHRRKSSTEHPGLPDRPSRTRLKAKRKAVRSLGRAYHRMRTRSHTTTKSAPSFWELDGSGRKRKRCG